MEGSGRLASAAAASPPAESSALWGQRGEGSMQKNSVQAPCDVTDHAKRLPAGPDIRPTLAHTRGPVCTPPEDRPSTLPRRGAVIPPGGVSSGPRKAAGFQTAQECTGLSGRESWGQRAGNARVPREGEQVAGEKRVAGPADAVPAMPAAA